MGLPDRRAGRGRGVRDRRGFPGWQGRDQNRRGGGFRINRGAHGGGGSRGMRSVTGNILVEPYLHTGVFIARLKDGDRLLTRNMAAGEFVPSTNRIVVNGENHEKIEYRVWSPSRSKLGAAILSGVGNIHMAPGSKVLCLGAAATATVSHVSDIVGPDGLVYAVEICQESRRDLLREAKKRKNIIPIIEDVRYPDTYRMVVGIVDTIYADVTQPDQASILALNAHYFLKDGGHFVIIIKASCVDRTITPEEVYAGEVQKLQSERLKATEQVIMKSYKRGYAAVVGNYRPADKCENNEESEKKDELEE